MNAFDTSLRQKLFSLAFINLFQRNLNYSKRNALLQHDMSSSEHSNLKVLKVKIASKTFYRYIKKLNESFSLGKLKSKENHIS